MLPEGWDSYGAACVDHNAIRYVLRLLLRISSANTPAPSLVPLPDGGVQIEWHTTVGDLEIEVSENGLLRIYAPGLADQEECESGFQSAITHLEEIISRFS